MEYRRTSSARRRLRANMGRRSCTQSPVFRCKFLVNAWRRSGGSSPRRNLFPLLLNLYLGNLPNLAGPQGRWRVWRCPDRAASGGWTLDDVLVGALPDPDGAGPPHPARNASASQRIDARQHALADSLSQHSSARGTEIRQRRRAAGSRRARAGRQARHGKGDQDASARLAGGLPESATGLGDRGWGLALLERSQHLGRHEPAQ